MFNLQSTPNPFTNSTGSFVTKFLPLSEIMTDEQSRLLTIGFFQLTHIKKLGDYFLLINVENTYCNRVSMLL